MQLLAKLQTSLGPCDDGVLGVERTKKIVAKSLAETSPVSVETREWAMLSSVSGTEAILME